MKKIAKITLACLSIAVLAPLSSEASLNPRQRGNLKMLLKREHPYLSDAQIQNLIDGQGVGNFYLTQGFNKQSTLAFAGGRIAAAGTLGGGAAANNPPAANPAPARPVPAPRQDLERKNAAIKIQALVRGRQARKQFSEMKRAEAARLEAQRLEVQKAEAATTIQNRFRGYQARKELAKMKAQKAEAARLEEQRLEAAKNSAATTLQSRFRGSRARKEFSKMQEAARNEAARLEAERLEREKNSAATTLQSRFRGIRARKQFDQTKAQMAAAGQMSRPVPAPRPPVVSNIPNPQRAPLPAGEASNVIPPPPPLPAFLGGANNAGAKQIPTQPQALLEQIRKKDTKLRATPTANPEGSNEEEQEQMNPKARLIANMKKLAMEKEKQNRTGQNRGQETKGSNAAPPPSPEFLAQITRGTTLRRTDPAPKVSEEQRKVEEQKEAEKNKQVLDALITTVTELQDKKNMAEIEQKRFEKETRTYLAKKIPLETALQSAKKELDDLDQKINTINQSIQAKTADQNARSMASQLRRTRAQHLNKVESAEKNLEAHLRTNPQEPKVIFTTEDQKKLDDAMEKRRELQQTVQKSMVATGQSSKFTRMINQQRSKSGSESESESGSEWSDDKA